MIHAVVGLILGGLAAASGPPVIIFRATSEVAVFYGGIDVLAREGQQDIDYEKLLGVVPSGQTFAQNTVDKSSFIVRTFDHRFRFKVTVHVNADDSKHTYPYKLTFKNLMMEGKHGELVHDVKGFQWFPPGGETTHGAAAGREFELRDEDKRSIFTVVLDDARDEL
mmetsp:Transcript_113580/g.321290  ORF Transcript_113580/g.321290 Transcript_113580/m.321290 type:complete len:166 (-) Transcript_113580:123-620(-)